MTPHRIPFTPAPREAYQTLCEDHASLTAYIEREAPEMRASGQHDALAELEQVAAAQWERLRELHAQLSAGGAG
jgi:hypothetical protein